MFYFCSIYLTVIDNPFADDHTSSQDSGDTIIVKNSPITALTLDPPQGILLGKFVPNAGSYITPNAWNTFTLSYDSVSGNIMLMNTDPPIVASDIFGTPLTIDNLFVDSGLAILSNWNVCGLGLGKL